MTEQHTQLTIEKIENTESNMRAAVRLFVDAYFDQLSGISRDTDRWERALAGTFVLERFYGAFLGDTLVGMFALLGPGEAWIRLDRKRFIDAMGALKGRIAYPVLRKELEHEVTLAGDGKYISTVATDTKHQGKGIATTMMKYAIENNRYLELDVVDTNERAFNLYKKLGFEVFREEPVRFFKKAVGFNKKIFMRYKRAE